MIEEQEEELRRQIAKFENYLKTRHNTVQPVFSNLKVLQP